MNHRTEHMRHALFTDTWHVLFSILRKTLQGFAHVPGAGMTEAEMLVSLPKVLSVPYYKGQRGLHWMSTFPGSLQHLYVFSDLCGIKTWE